MDNLKSKFKDKEFDLKEVPTGHKDRFLDKLNRELPKNKRNKKWLLPVLSYAAAASIGIILFLSIIESSEMLQREDSIILITETAENIESEVYLQKEVKSRIEVIKNLDRAKKHTSKLIDDISEFDNSLFRLKSDLQEAPGDQRIVDAVLNTYIMKIEALDNIVNILQKIS